MIEVKLGKDHVKQIEITLGNLSSKAPNVLKNAINTTAKQARKNLQTEAKLSYVIKASRFNKAINLKSATVGNPAALLSSKGQALELLDYRVTPKAVLHGKNRPSFLKAKVKKSSSLKPLLTSSGTVKPFIAKFKSGHVAVVERVPGIKYKSPKGLQQREAKKLDPTRIKKLYSPSIPAILGDENNVYGRVEPKIRSDLHDNILKNMSKLLEA